MSDVTQILERIEAGDQSAADQLLPLVYDELRKLAAQRLAQEMPGQTLQATALVHEAYIRLVDIEKTGHWDGRGHFFAAAAEAMRRILVERARQKSGPKRGGHLQRIDLDIDADVAERADQRILALDEALSELEQHHALAAALVKLRYFAGMQHQDAARALGIKRRTADRLWVLAKTWLFQHIHDQ